MKRVLLLVSVSGAIALWVAACSSGGGDPSAGNGTNTPTRQPEPTPEPTPEPVPEPTPEPTPEPPPQVPTVEDVPPCGEDGQPDCPLDHWMEENTLRASEDGDLPALAAALHKIEFLAPDEAWNTGEDGWAQTARRGATAAEAGELRGARASCKACHRRWRKQYRAEHRRRPVPGLREEAAQGRPDLP
jgi:hypothetical protein